MLMQKCLTGRAPQHLIDEWRLAGGRRYHTQCWPSNAGNHQVQYDIIRDRSFATAASQVWNSLPDSVRDFTLCEDTFAKHLKLQLII